MEGLHDYSARLLLRYFRAGRLSSVTKPKLDAWEDLDFLRYHWSVSPPVLELCEHVRLNRHEMQSSLDERVRLDDAVVRGRLNASATVLERAVSGYPTRVVFAEPVRSYTSGPNHVLVWVLQRAHLLLARFAHESSDGVSYTAQVAHALAAVAAARRISSVAQAIAESDYTHRPSPQSLQQAAGARKRLYRLAHTAYLRLQQIEELDPVAIAQTLQDTLVAPLHEWQTFELALALAMGAAISDTSGAPLRLKRIAPGSTSALIEVGDYIVHWQSQTASYALPEQEPSERIVNRVLAEYGLTLGGDRPDIVITNRSGKILALGEAKYFTNETEGWSSALRAAANQLVRYSRGYASGPALDDLLGRSVVGLWSFPQSDRPADVSATTPLALDFSDLLEGRMSAWAKRALISFEH